MKPKTLRLPNGTRVMEKFARGMPVLYTVQMAVLTKHQDPSGRPVMGYIYTCTRPNGSYATLTSEQVQIYSGPATTQATIKKSSSQYMSPPTLSQMKGGRNPFPTVLSSIPVHSGTSSQSLVNELMPSSSESFMSSPASKFHKFRLAGKPLPDKVSLILESFSGFSISFLNYTSSLPPPSSPISKSRRKNRSCRLRQTTGLAKRRRRTETLL